MVPPNARLRFKTSTKSRGAEYLVHKPSYDWEIFRVALLAVDIKMSSTDATLFEEHFTVTAIDASKYDRVSRIEATSNDSQTVFSLDINTEIYPIAINDGLHVVLATSLAIDGSKEEKGWRDVGRAVGGEATLADMFDYVCHGKLYKFEDSKDGDQM